MFLVNRIPLNPFTIERTCNSSGGCRHSAHCILQQFLPGGESAFCSLFSKHKETCKKQIFNMNQPLQAKTFGVHGNLWVPQMGDAKPSSVRSCFGEETSVIILGVPSSKLQTCFKGFAHVICAGNFHEAFQGRKTLLPSRAKLLMRLRCKMFSHKFQ